MLLVVCYLAFDVRMESFTDKERHSKSRSSKLIQAAEDANSCLLPLDQGLPIWRHIETPVYRKFRLAQEYLERWEYNHQQTHLQIWYIKWISWFEFSVAVDLVSQKISYFDERSSVHKESRRSLLDDYLLNPKLDLADVVAMACDVLLTGVDTVNLTWFVDSYLIFFNLFFLVWFWSLFFVIVVLCCVHLQRPHIRLVFYFTT